ncbi:MAG: CofH family radical SAM protein [bacterium]|nr:CofH family radical SAM protein [bacterium]MDT8396274.1 CofH family radical SAM protein [bacterium]
MKTIMNAAFSTSIEKGAAGQRLTRAEAFALIGAVTPDTLHLLGEAALENRTRRWGNDATYIFNIQINPANICTTGCAFCNYAARPEEAHAYILSEEEIIEKVGKLAPTEVHIVGGLNSVWPYERNLGLVRELRRRFPVLHIKAFTAVEIAFFARTAAKSERRVIEELIEAGIDAMPGGGAEIFSGRLREKYWKNKIRPSEWIHIHQLAHSMGVSTNATMLFGFGETWTERVEHLLTLRDAQDTSDGFSCFIPLAFQPGEGRFIEQGPTPLDTLSVLAVSRLVLDNISHLKSYWPMIGLETAAAGLSWGADDLDGTIGEEKIAHMAGAKTPFGLARDRMVETISTAGFRPRERDGRFTPMNAPSPSTGVLPGDVTASDQEPA